MNKHDQVKNDLDRIDAAIFSGDFLEYENNRKVLKKYLIIWSRELKMCGEHHET